MKYRIEWWQRQDRLHSKRQSVVMFTDEDVLHCEAYSTRTRRENVDVIPILGE